MSQEVKELKSYFDTKFSYLEKGLSSSNGRKRKREHEFKYKSNRKQFEFNEDIQHQISEAILLVKEGSRKLDDVLSDIRERNKLIRLADKSPGGWATVAEYESDSLASDTEDEKKMKAAEKRAMSKMKSKKKSASSTYSRVDVDRGGNFNRLSYKGFRRTSPNDICLRCGKKGHWKRTCRVKINNNNNNNNDNE